MPRFQKIWISDKDPTPFSFISSACRIHNATHNCSSLIVYILHFLYTVCSFLPLGMLALLSPQAVYQQQYPHNGNKDGDKL